MPPLRRTPLVAAVAALVVGGSVYAAAASLGGITSDSVGADDSALTSCDSDGVSTAYTTAWDAVDERYEITEVTVSGIDVACNGLNAYVTLTDAGGAQISAGTSAINATSEVVTVAPAAGAEVTTGVHVLLAT